MVPIFVPGQKRVHVDAVKNARVDVAHIAEHLSSLTGSLGVG